MMNASRLPLGDWYVDHMLVFGHRGSSGHAPMNTLPAFALALEQGADGVELDVWLSRDHELVVIHDATVDHTTDGQGYVWDKTLAELKALRAAYRFTEDYPEVRIPTLGEVFETIGHQLLINVEIKYDPQMIAGVEKAVAEEIGRFGLEQRVLVSSFSATVLRTFHALKPSVAVAFLHAPDTPQEEFDIIADVPVQALHPHHLLIDAAYIEQARRDNLRVNTWTVNDTVEAQRLRDLGVDAIMTDLPDVMLQALRAPHS